MNNFRGQEKKLSSIAALEKLLIEIIGNPRRFCDTQSIRSSLSSQGKLASMSYSFVDGETEYRIDPMSLNSMKSYARELFSDGYDRINELRVAAIKALEISEEQQETSNKRTRVGLQKAISQLEVQVENQQKTIVVLLQAVNACLNTIRLTNKTVDTNLREKRANDGIAIIHDIVGLAKIHTVMPADVVNMDDYRRGP